MLNHVTLDDKYTREEGRIFLTGTQALVRLALMQRRRDLAAGLNTAGYVTGYRGSPLGGIDREFGRAEAHLRDHHVKFHPAVNEDLAATALWGSQQLNIFEGARYDGVFGIWYGKGPGVDRSGDVFRHANFAGTAPHGGVLALAGDDPACKSSTVPSQSEHALMDAHIPILNPANVQEILDFGLYGWAMSRYSGCWVGMKCITDNIDTTASVLIDPERVNIRLPDDFDMPDGGLHIRWPDPAMDQEHRLQRHKIYAALAFARANGLNRVTMDSAPGSVKPRFGIISTGKSYLDVLQALDDLGIGAEQAEQIGLRLLKVGMPWPLEKDVIRTFAEGLEEILVVEEKRAVMENQIKEQLYNWRADMRPRVVGKFNETGEWILPSAGELTPARIARVIARRIEGFSVSDPVRTLINERLAFLEDKERALEASAPGVERIPYFCSGCPHNISTKVPEGSRAAAGIGCHYMAIWMDRNTATFTHMGGEGANWLGQAPFTDTKHIFVNIGDGTYFHSGILAIRAAVAANVNITYKILYNDAVAMTGGQPMDGPLDVPMISAQVRAEGVDRIAVVSDEPHKYPVGADFASGVTFHHRDDLDALQRDLRNIQGVSVLIYDQTCAAEKRRRRKRGLYPDPAARPFINAAVCEGCGDCGVQSNCVAIQPLETELGRKRAINQSSCNKDFTCIKGFCPAFVTVHDAQPRKPDAVKNSPHEAQFETMPDPVLADAALPYGILVTGIGGTGVVTVGAILSMAAHLEGKGVSVLDIAGLAQKNGAVYSHVRISGDPEKLHAVRLAAGGAKLLIGCDMVVSASAEALGKLNPGVTSAIVNANRTMTSNFTAKPDLEFPEQKFRDALAEATGPRSIRFVDATGLALGLLGDAIAANMFMVGYAYQKGLLPVSADAIEHALDLNGVAVVFNKQAFLWGRRAAHDLDAVTALLPADTLDGQPPKGHFIDRRAADLTRYQNAAYARRYMALVERVHAAEAEKTPDKTGLSNAVAKAYFKLLAVKDEYEVARLYTDGSFERALKREFEGPVRLSFHMAPPLFARRDPATGELQKQTFGPSISRGVMAAFRLMAGLKGLRGTAFDIFGYTAERKGERRMIRDYEAVVEELIQGLGPDTHGLAVEIAGLPLSVRGFGHVKERNRLDAKASEEQLLAGFRNGATDLKADAAE
ncbi:MAG: indolepyruvate ferredoxin oxidoreductase family protein [Rhodospirillales bacterium]|nr:indolepyruvate ferredoxin oxidoreductase family protein [Alphaproteobacteria bacterium]MBL6947959.1 indolepyruvate ferredoxin oxidoreductase family protein [Rhodospirillales bacterium]